MRLRTLPLSEAGVVLGMLLALQKAGISFLTGMFLILTTALLQILSNLSNELGDTLHGTDTDERQGIRYSLQDGEMTVPQMKRLIATVCCLCCVSGLLMIWFSFASLFDAAPIALVALGIAANWAAINYTLGSRPYGYRGLGDIFVFIFFGIVSVGGSYFVCSHELDGIILLPAAAIGFFSVAVLNVNNIRDMKTDMATRTTIAIKMGEKRARIYQTVLVSLGWLLMILFTALTAHSLKAWIYVITIPLFALHLRGVWTRRDRELDSMLPLLVMSTFLTSLLLGFGLL